MSASEGMPPAPTRRKRATSENTFPKTSPPGLLDASSEAIGKLAWHLLTSEAVTTELLNEPLPPLADPEHALFSCMHSLFCRSAVVKNDLHVVTFSY
jgi:hypothetical protein